MPNVEKIAILVNRTKAGSGRIVDSVCAKLEEYAIAYVIFDRYLTKKEKLSEEITRSLQGVTLLISIGGDGTLLNALRLALTGGFPVLPIYNGTLGFIAETQFDESMLILDELIEGRQDHYDVERRHLLDIAVTQQGAVTKHNAINEAVLLKGSYPRLTHFDISINGKNVAYVKADGVIVASPTGSTAYALSVGGPIVNPRVNALILAPIAPHSLTFRPLVLPGDDVITLTSLADAASHLHIDGQEGEQLHKGDSVTVTISEKCFYLYKYTSRTFYEVLKDKLKWGN